MKKRLLAVLLTGVMAMSMLTACGGSDETTTGAATADVAEASTDGEMCSDETFSALQDSYAVNVKSCAYTKNQRPPYE